MPGRLFDRTHRLGSSRYELQAHSRPTFENRGEGSILLVDWASTRPDKLQMVG